MNKIEYSIKPPGKFSLNLKELWIYRELFYFFVWRDIKVKYKQTVLGFLWAVLQPLIMMGIFTLFFAKALSLSTGGLPAPIFYLSGLLFWNLFSAGLSTSANSIVSNANIIKKIYFPRLIIPFSGVFVAFFDFLMAFVIFIGMLIYYSLTIPEFQVDPSIIWNVLLAILITLFTSIGLGSILSAWTVKYRDFRYVVPFVIQALFFVTPVIYPISIVAKYPILKYVLGLNPMTGAVMLGRRSFVVPGDVASDNLIIMMSVGISILLLGVGVYVFRKTEYYFADLA